MAMRPWISSKAHKRGRAGFTLLELITALAVLGVAATVFLRLFSSSLSLASTSLSHEVAVGLAEEYLTTIQSSPERFDWPDLEDTASGKIQPIRPIEEIFPTPPEAMPTLRRAYNRDHSFYRDFSWEAFAVLPEDEAQYVEVLVEISWTDEGYLRRFSLASIVPRSLAERAGS